MGIDTMDIRVWVWKILQFFMNACFACIQKHPFVSGILFFSFILYNFYSSVIRFLIHTSPIIVCTLVLLKILLCLGPSETQNVEKEEKRNRGISSEKSGLAEDDLVFYRNETSSLQSLTGSRRNVKEKNKGLDDLIGRKEIRKRKASSCLDCEEGHYHNASNAEKVQTFDEQHRQVIDSKPSKADFTSHYGSNKGSENIYGGGGGGDELEAESPEEAEDEDEEEAQEEGNKAVKWTENDQKNLMDLGISEIERNKRLESLIAKRRARKLLKKQVEKDLIDLDGDPQGQIAPIFIARSNLLALPNNSDGIDGLMMPRSAPSVLLPTQNPFDLPYDPLEEKPYLMGDSFQEEFMADPQKDLFFCRHESFSLGPSFPMEPKQDQQDSNFSPFFGTEWKAPDGRGYSRFKRHSDEKYNEKLPEQALTQEGGPMSHIENVLDNGEQRGQNPVQVLDSEEIKLEDDREVGNGMIKVNGEKDSTHDNGGSSLSSSSSSSSSAVSEENFNANKVEVSENLEPITDNFPMVFGNSLQKSIAACDLRPSAVDKTRIEEHLLLENMRANHTPACSIASDMQVEISEVGSPPLTVDGTISPADGESLTYDGDVEKDITSGSEEMWGESSHLSGVEETESRSREVHAISEEDFIEVGFSGVNQDSKDPISSPVLPEQVVEHASQRTELPEAGQAHSVDFDQKIHDEVQRVVVEEMKKPMSSSSSDALPHENLASPVPEKAQDLTEKLVALPSGGDDSENPKEPYDPPVKSMGEVNNINIVSDPVGQANDDTGNLQSNKDQYGESQRLINRAADEDPLKVADEASSKSIEHFVDNFEIPEEHKTIPGSYKQVKDNDHSESNKEFEGEFKKLIQHEGIADESKPVEDKNNLKSTQDNEGEQVPVEFGLSGSNKEFEGEFEKLIQHEGIADESKAVEDKNNLKSTQDNEGEQVPVEFGLSEANQNSDDPMGTAVQPEVAVVQEVHHDSGSILSPKSVLPENVQMDQVASLTFHQVVHEVVEQSDVDANSLHGMPPENSSLTPPQNVQHLIEDSMALPSNNGDIERLQEPSNPPEKSSEEANILSDVNESVVHGKEGHEKLTSLEDFKGELQTLLNHEAATELSKPAEETKSRPIEDASKELTGCDATFWPSKPDQENNNTNIPFIMGREEDSNPLANSTAEANAIYNANETVLGEKEDNVNLRSVADSAGESQSLMRQEAVVEPSKPAEETSSRPMENIDGESKKLIEDEAIIGPSKSPEENVYSSTIKNVEELETSTEHEDVIHLQESADPKDDLRASKDVESELKNLTENEAMVDSSSKPDMESYSSNIPVTVVEGEVFSNPFLQWSTQESNISNNTNNLIVGEDEFQRTVRQDAVMDPLEAVKLNTVKSTVDIEGVPEKLTEDEMTIGPSIPERETDNTNTIIDIEVSGLLTHHEDAIDQPKPGNGKDSLEAIVLIEEDTEVKSLDYKILVEPSKPSDSKVEVPNLDMDNGYKGRHEVAHIGKC